MNITDSTRELVEILQRAETLADLQVLVEGLFTPSEIEEVVNRWRLMLKLDSGVQTQREIAAELGISLGKIARGSRLLQYGPRRFRKMVRDARGELKKT